MVFPQNTYAVYSTEYNLNPNLPYESTLACAGLTGTWSNSTNICNLSSRFILDPGHLVRVEVGATLNITHKLTIQNDNRIINFGVIINNKYRLENYGIIDNYKGGRIDSGPGIIVDRGGFFTNYNGAILNIRGFTNYDFLYNNGTIIIDFGGKISNSGDGIIENYGIIINNGEITNTKIINNYGTIHNYNLNSSIYNKNNGDIINYDDGIIINSDGIFFNEGRFENIGIIDNKGIIDNYGSILNNGNVINNSTGLIINHNTGTIDNKYAINNYGTITAKYGKFDNGGTIKNKCGGAISGTISGNPLTNICTSTTTITIIHTITSTTSVEQIAEPIIYVWAVGATVITIVLAIILILRKRR